MAQTQIHTLGDSLRMVADVVDARTELTLGLAYPEIAFTVDFPVTSPEIVAGFAAASGTDLHTHVTETGDIHTSTDLYLGVARIHVFAITRFEDVRELRRPTAVTEELSGRDL